MDESVEHSSQNQNDSELQACCFFHCQGNIQATLRPAVWCPGFRSPHFYREKWEVATNPTVCVDELIQTIRNINTSPDEHGGKLYELAKVNHEDSFVQINLYTYGQWLSVIDFKFSQQEKATSSIAEVRAFSTGLLPVSLPLSFFFNSLCFCIPFCDFGKNKKWLKRIREALPLNVKVIDRRRGC